MKKSFPKSPRGPRAPRISNVLTDPIAFFCKDCELIVEGRPIGRKFVYKCARCGTKNVAFGTEKALRDFYRVKEESEVKKENTEQKSRKEP
ncbi:MAG: hypothetical protein R3B71_00080 [Candidatus Gracilibacteria bacterium]|nr:hypothetical protein [Candidatus Peregrinibacteria bacterium]